MRLVTIHNEKLKKLQEGYVLGLKENGYAEVTLKKHINTIKQIQVYMDARGIMDYSPDVGNAYYQNYIETHAGQVNCDSIKAVVKKFNIFLEEGWILPLDRGAFYNESLRDIMDKLEIELQSRGYSDNAISYYKYHLRCVQEFMRKQKIDQYSRNVGEAYIDMYLESHPQTTPLYKRIIVSCISRFNDIAEGRGYIRLHPAVPGIMPPNDFYELTAIYLEHCRTSGNKSKTLRIKEITISQFLHNCVNEGCKTIEELTPSIVISACNSLKSKRYHSNLGPFLQFLALEGYTQHDLSTFVPHIKREIKIPSTYSIDEIRNAESVINRNDPRGKRDYVIFLLASRLGIRSGDIAVLHKSNIDFANERIVFSQQKTSIQITYPLIPEIRNALEDHIACSGYTAEGYLFSNLLAPHEMLTNTTIGKIITKYLKMANINIEGKHHGPHSLRASMATSMVNDNVPYSAVRKALGHTDPNTIRHYAKNDLENLRRCALEVPLASGVLLDFLGGEAFYE